MFGDNRELFRVLPIKGNPYGTHQGWRVQTERLRMDDSKFKKKSDAVEKAKELAKDNKPSKLIVHKKNGDKQYEKRYPS